ncbi:MAG TPA: hypothetical protein V6C78_22480 [Crinalium sp.]|jgi:uncharacterized membrane-anchored protein YhcB (DUF1043 family)
MSQLAVRMTIELTSKKSQTTIESELKEVKAKLGTKRQDVNTYRLVLNKQAEEQQSECKQR